VLARLDAERPEHLLIGGLLLARGEDNAPPPGRAAVAEALP
jgi:hypothetical protein